jgi:pimeloyl-ACP methyl ester carboxylesterase
MDTLTRTQNSHHYLKYYRDVPQEYLQPFLEFRGEHPFKTVSIHNIRWEYLDVGYGPEVLLLLPGALGVPIMDWRHISYFSQQVRVIAPSYAPLASMNAMVDSIAGILAAESIPSAHVWGGSYGGFVAQVFVRRHPNLTEKLILSHSLPPSPETGATMRKMLRWMRLLPGFLLRWIMNRSFKRLLPEKTEGMALTIAIYNELMHTRMTKADIMAILHRTKDFSEMLFSPNDLDSWSGSVLLILSDDDPSTPEEVRNALQALYPEAKTHLFHGAGHATSHLQENAYRYVIETFINE